MEETVTFFGIPADEGHAPMQDILIVKPSALGDVIQATCVLPVLKEAFPGVRISWLVFEHNAEIVRGHPLVDNVLAVRRRGGIAALPGIIRSLRAPRFDTVIDLQGLLRSAVLSRLTGCPRRIGFADGREQSTLFYTETFDLPRHSMHAVDRYLALCGRLGAQVPAEPAFPLPVRDAHRTRIVELLGDFAGGKPLVVVNPTAKWPSKRWPAGSFASVADTLTRRCRAGIVLVGGPSETTIVSETASLMACGSLDLSGRISIMELAALLERADLFLGNDSGPMHLASATRTPTVAVFGPTDPLRTGPYNRKAAVVRAQLDCMPCFRRSCDRPRCLEEVTPQKVADVCEEVLAGPRRKPEGPEDSGAVDSTASGR